jgi:hypothetical protein
MTASFGHDLPWRRSGYCTAASCVEFAIIPDCVVVRNSRLPEGPFLTFTLDEWTAFTRGQRDKFFVPSVED